ncbi:hypothetical protein FRC07_001950 [Ceratobasidium sp. 392]|nr:hypothetical protein FRC07_001950 [Ceratobasidium sp. 392]
MAPLSRALADLELQSSSKAGDSNYTCHGTVDPDWAADVIPNGGYIFCLLVMAGIKSQRKTKHQDPIHVTAHFISLSTISSYKIEVQVVRSGSRFTNILVNWVQDGEIKVMTHMIFGTLPAFDAPPSTSKYEDIPPSHPLHHHIPLLSHPSNSPLEPIEPIHLKRVRFTKHLRRAEDTLISARNKAKLAKREGGLESGLWVELVDEDKELELAMLPIFADMFRRMPTLLSQADGNGNPIKRYPSVLMTIEFKRRLPRPGTPGFSARTLGLFSKGLFLDHGRHDTYCEIWTAPSDLGQPRGKEAPDESWKRDMRCIAVTTQMGLTVSLDGKKRRAKL